jgi:dipeptidyl aminopeptidase/acylaminoacyl peptidase
MMQKDMRETSLYQEAQALYEKLRRPGTGLISDAAEIATNGTHAAFAGAIPDALSGSPQTRICLTDLNTGDTRILTFGPNVDRLPKFSPDGRQIAFLSDRRKAGDFQLYLLDLLTGAAHATPPVDGWVEYLHWSPDGSRILLGVAGHGADVSGGQGAVTSRQAKPDSPSWLPAVETGEESFRWRRVWVYERANGHARPIGDAQHNVWEAVWCGNNAVAAVVSPGPGEGLWYTARLAILHIASGETREVYHPRDQLGWPAGSPSGRHLAVVEAICSDRWIVAGDLSLIDTASGKVVPVDTQGVDITCTEWRSDRHLLLGGHRGFDTVVGLYDVESGQFSESWRSREITGTGRYISVSGIGESADFVFIAESFLRAPEIGMVRGGAYDCVKSFDVGYAELVKTVEAVESVTWKAPDGLEIQGWLLRPAGRAPFPLVTYVHGGPVGHWRPCWLGRSWLAHALMLLKRGYAAFFPNPRGSGGRGQDFARRVYGDMGGADAQDLLAGVDALIARGVADPKRLGVTGGSYGGFMTAWLITQDARFAAAIPFSPHTNQVSEHLISNIPHFMALIMQDRYDNPSGKYFERSPIMHARNVKTPTLNICGALDRCTPPEEAIQFHAALLENGVKSVLVTYPEEGHGVRKWPALIDFSARVVGWFERHMGAAGVV